jgi:hypothetical protein
MPHVGGVGIYNGDYMKAKSNARPRGPWTQEEIAREERADRARTLHDQEKTPEVRLQEALRLSRFMSELRQGLADDVRTR